MIDMQAGRKGMYKQLAKQENSDGQKLVQNTIGDLTGTLTDIPNVNWRHLTSSTCPPPSFQHHESMLEQKSENHESEPNQLQDEISVTGFP